MSKLKKISLILIPILSVLLLTNLVVYILGLLGTIAFVIFLTMLLMLLGVDVFLLIFAIKKSKKNKSKPVIEKVTNKEDPLSDFYDILGIPIQYNKDGSIKDVYDLLGIEPVFDEQGNRYMTIYELLGMMPRFDKNGKEIPLVFSIKNRIGRIARVDLTSRVLTRRLSEKEKEELFINQTLKKKLDEAQKNGDVAKVETIKKIVEQKKAAKDGGTSLSSPKFKPGKSGGKPASFGNGKSDSKVSAASFGDIASFVGGLFGILRNRNDQENKKEEPKPTVETKKPVEISLNGLLAEVNKKNNSVDLNTVGLGGKVIEQENERE